MSLSAPSDVSPPQHLSVVGAFKAAPTLVKVLAASFYLPALLLVVECVRVAFDAHDEVDGGIAVIFSFLGVLVGLLLAMVGFLLGKGIARGARGTWLLALVLTVIALLACFQSLWGYVSVYVILNTTVMVALLALLLTPVVRHHCTKK